MNCEWFEEQISALIDHEISDQQSAEVFTHLGACPACRAFLTSTQHLRAVMSEHAEAVPERLDARIRTIPRAEGWKDLATTVRHAMTWWKRRLAIPAPAFALLVLMLLMSAAMIFGLLRTTSFQRETQPSSVVYIMSLSPIEVTAERIHDPQHIQ